MRTRNITIIGILLFCVTYSCLNEHNHVPPETPVSEDFQVNEARKHFEENGSGLSSLCSFGEIQTRSSTKPKQSLTPEWNKAITSGNSNVKLIEVPIQSNSTGFCFSQTVHDGKVKRRERMYTQRRLVIALRNNGEVEMFVATIIPTTRQARKNPDNFRYLGGGDFTGHVFCSTLDGKFVKAFGYTNGRRSGRLSIRKKTDMEKQDYQNYVLIGLGEADMAATRSSAPVDEAVETTETTEEATEETGESEMAEDTGEIINDYTTIEDCISTTDIDEEHCMHGNPWGECKQSNCIVAVAIFCSYCNTTNECKCPRCPDCDAVEQRCYCPKCYMCKEKILNCKCFDYETTATEEETTTTTEPENSDTQTTTGGNGDDALEILQSSNPEELGGGYSPPALPPAPKPNKILSFTASQFKETGGYKSGVCNCLCMAGKIMRQLLGNDAKIGSSANVMQLWQDVNGVLTKVGNATTVFNTLNSHLDNNRSIIAGVDHTLQKHPGNNDKTTDHFIVITGRGYDSGKGQYYYNYVETGRTFDNGPEATSDSNRLYYDSSAGTFTNPKGFCGSNGYMLTQIRPNSN